MAFTSQEDVATTGSTFHPEDIIPATAVQSILAFAASNDIPRHRAGDGVVTQAATYLGDVAEYYTAEVQGIASSITFDNVDAGTTVDFLDAVRCTEVTVDTDDIV